MNEHGFYENDDGTVYYSFISGTREQLDRQLEMFAEFGWGPEGGPVPTGRVVDDADQILVQAISGPPARWVTDEEE